MGPVSAATVAFKDSFAPLAFARNGKTDWLQELRQRAHRRFAEAGFPDRRSEDWKYILLDPLLKSHFAPAVAAELRPNEQKEAARFFLSDNEKNRLVFVNGVYSKKFSTLEPGSKVWVEDLAGALRSDPEGLRPYLARGLESETNAFALINTFSFTDGAVIRVPDGVTLESPLHLLFLNIDGDSPEVTYPRVLITLGRASTAHVVLNCAGMTPASHFSNLVSEAFLGEGSQLDYSLIQRDTKAFQFFTGRFYQEKDSVLKFAAITRDGALTRNEARVYFRGENAEASLKGLAVLKGDAQAYHHVTVEHASPHCRSDQFYKNILADSARSEFNSLVYVHPGAQKSDSRQLNKNLLLSDAAQGFSRPQLKILNDDVACAHGSATGQLDENELFYLRSRGLSKETAGTLLVYGFGQEILRFLSEPRLREQLEAALREDLAVLVKGKF